MNPRVQYKKSVMRIATRYQCRFKGQAISEVIMNRIRTIVTLVITSLVLVSSWSSNLNDAVVRRDFLIGSSSASITWLCGISSVQAAESVNSRLDQSILNLPPPSYAGEMNGVDNTYYPPFLLGNWDVEQILVSTTVPLGLKFIGGPNADLTIAEKTMTEARSKIGIPVKLQLRYVATKWGVAEDRLFNIQSRLDAYAGKAVVASVNYADVGGSNRKSVVALGGTADDPLQTTVTYFKGPAAQKSFLLSHGAEKLGDKSWAGYELQRSIFALTNQSTVPPITTDVEYIWKLDEVDGGTVTGRLRIAEYLNAQSDKLYFDARNRAVSIQDYTLEMRQTQ